jgi:hypothetical protein
MKLVKAQLCEISGDAAGREIGTPVDVQFNPTTLRMAISNKTAGGSQPGAQAKQKPGTGEVTVTFDLFFDTADEGRTDAPVPVTRKTQIVEKFVRPRDATPAGQSPPRVQFKWGGFLVQGVMESANIDLDLFAADGTPLRAKVAVSIKGQDPSYRYNPLTPPPVGAAPSGKGPEGLPPGTPGTKGGGGSPASVAEALPGESLAQLAARVGLDPNGWRALADGVADPQSLSPGQEVALPPTLRSGAGIGGAAARGASGANPVLAGQELARAGGVTGAASTRENSTQAATASASAAAFGLAPQPGAEIAGRGYGAGVPLRPLVGGAGTAPVAADPTAPGWLALQPKPAALRPRGRTAGCGCGGR